MSFYINFANNLIEKYQTSAAAAISNAAIVFLMGRVIRDYQRTGGVKEVGTENNIL